MKERLGKFGTVFLALALCLAITGAGFAMWSDTLTIQGEINTGEVAAEWTACYCFDYTLDPNPDGSFKDKDVGSTTCVIDAVDPTILHITVDNAYPSYWNDCEVEYTNTGTVPVKVQSITITPHNFALASANGANDGEIWIDLVHLTGTQLHHGDSNAGSFKIHVEQCAAEGATYTFDVKILVVQWNEYTP